MKFVLLIAIFIFLDIFADLRDIKMGKIFQAI